ncbi:hypothetical protein HK44_015350 [Pseudomonas fluorescens HK44]|uniref:Uncharacterized protein n=1 Tax=Pseudomonas fluorescens HK44 TaxID=1042209 RepID=A0A010RTH3_PSEFL|nr:hypothetical protein HK44_015350 [Pseudomonas fluorescens HK44]
MSSAFGVQKIGGLIESQAYALPKSCFRFFLELHLSKAFGAHHRRNPPTFNIHFRIILRFDSANSVVCCAVFFTNP